VAGTNPATTYQKKSINTTATGSVLFRAMKLPYCPAAVLLLVVMTSLTALAQQPGPPTDGEILALMKTHCVMCHGADPTHPAFASAPAGVLLEEVPQTAANAGRIMAQVVVNRFMPLGNETGMTDEERNRVAAWIEGLRK
jgi:uncharacterized membrane protein